VLQIDSIVWFDQLNSGEIGRVGGKNAGLIDADDGRLVLINLHSIEPAMRPQTSKGCRD
jgi:hypothetical protein